MASNFDQNSTPAPSEEQGIVDTATQAPEVPENAQQLAFKEHSGIVSRSQTLEDFRLLPWENSKIDSKFFGSIGIDASRWDQLFPYRLMVIDTKTNTIVGSGGQESKATDVSVVKGTGITTLLVDPPNFQWILTLPITPQQLSIVDQYAVNTSATLRGVVEEHGGLRFKLISASGSMGVWTQRKSVKTPSGSPSALESIFGGTIAAASNLAAQATRVINTATTGHPASKPKTIRPGDPGTDKTSVGYYQALRLQQFLEQYVEAKKNPNSASWRLVFDIPKQNQSFVVSPTMFTWNQNVNKPMEILYSFQLKAWRRIILKVKAEEVQANNQPLTPGILQRIMSILREARATMSDVVSLIQAVRSDVSAPLEALRQIDLFVSDLVGAVISLCHLPDQIKDDYKSQILAYIAKYDTSKLDSNVAGGAKILTLIALIKTASGLKEGLTDSAVSSGQIGKQAANRQSVDPINNIFTNPNEYYTLQSIVPINSLALTPIQRANVNNIVSSIRLTTVDDLKQARTVIADLAFQLSNNFGAGDAYYNFVHGKPAPKVRNSPMTTDEFDILNKLYNVMQAVDILTATKQVDDLAIRAAQSQSTAQTGSGSRSTGSTSGNPSMDYVAGLASQSNIQFTTSTSKILSPVPFGLNIEQIAARYLGDPQRWLEIATLNDLNAPYIDENGFQLPLLSNASGRQVTISNITNMFQGQRIVLTNASVGPTARAILGIDRLSDTSFLLTLDGDPNLDGYTLLANSYIQAYLPGTINSQQKIFIPSNASVPRDSGITPPASTASDPLTGLSQVDWLLTDSGDIAVNSYGDFRYSSGITNIIQALKLKIGSAQGSVLLHPNYGLGLKPGIINSQIQVHDIFNSLNQMITQDARFQGVSNLQVSLNGPTLEISLGVAIKGQQGVFPLSFNLRS